MSTESLQGRVAVVTGASSGIGAAMARTLALAGMHVIMAARRQQQLGAIADEIRIEGGSTLPLAADVTDEAAVAGLFRAGLARFGRIDVLVNNAGIADHTPTEALSLKRWREVIDVNLTAAFLCAREALPIMKRQGRGRIVNVGSLSCKVPRPDTAAYVASKFALEGLTRSLALDGRDHGITASILHPGIVATGLVPGMEAMPPEQAMSAEAVAQMLLLMVSLPDAVNVLELLSVPIGAPFLGRG
jgi:NAD(P)-dependent dehydrogenase (short-subunit alcohol dehydrogenase family)